MNTTLEEKLDSRRFLVWGFEPSGAAFLLGAFDALGEAHSWATRRYGARYEVTCIANA